MAVFILAPVLKVLEEWVDLVVRVALQMPVDADIPPVANLQARAGDVTQRSADMLSDLTCASNRCPGDVACRRPTLIYHRLPMCKQP